MSQGADREQIPIYLSYGAGVESTAIICRWILEPETRPTDLSRISLVISQLGHEHDDTRDLVERHLFPLLRAHQVRFVQIAKAGKYERDGYVLLDDTRTPTTFFHRPSAAKPYYRLRDETGGAGTVVQLGGTHYCAIKFKGRMCDMWVADELAAQGTDRCRQAWGYAADEPRRVKKSEEALAERLAAGDRLAYAMAFGYAVGEESRVAKSERAIAARVAAGDPVAYAMAFGFAKGEERRVAKSEQLGPPDRLGLYPLVDLWGWDRKKCIAFLRDVFGVTWAKSACVQCPFSEELSKATPEGLDRFEANEEEAVETLVSEYVSMALNKRGTMFANGSLRSLLVENGRVAIVGKAFERMRGESWAVYRLRRLRNAPKPGKTKGSTPRCVEIVAEGAYDEIRARFLEGVCGTEAEVLGIVDVEEKEGISYAWVHKPHPELLPTREEFYVAAPRRVDPKVRGKLAKFEERWHRAAAAVPAVSQLPLFDLTGSSS